MEIRLKDYIKPGEVTAFVHCPSNFYKFKNNRSISYITDEIFHQNISVQKYLEKRIEKFSLEKFDRACQMVQLDENICFRNVSKLSRTEMKKLRLIEALLLNSETLVFVNFEQGFYEKSRNYYQKLLLKLTKYGKAIVVFSDDLTFLMGLVKKFYFVNENQCLLTDFYDDRLYECIPMPPLIEFVKLLRSHGLSMEKYVETKEILKAIYRSVQSGEHL